MPRNRARAYSALAPYIVDSIIHSISFKSTCSITQHSTIYPTTWQIGCNGRRYRLSDALLSQVSFPHIHQWLHRSRPLNPFIRHSKHRHLDDPFARHIVSPWTSDDPFNRHIISAIPRRITSSKLIQSDLNSLQRQQLPPTIPHPNPHRYPHQWLRKQLRKSICLHLHGKENWGQPQAITKFCGRNVLLPTSLHLPASLQSTVAQHRQAACYAKIWMSTIQADATIFIAQILRSKCSKSYNIFNVFNFPRSRPSTFTSHHSMHLVHQSLMLVTSNALSDSPELVFRSDFLHRLSYTSLLGNPDLWRRKLGVESYTWQSPGNACRIWKTTGYANFHWLMECAMRWIAHEQGGRCFFFPFARWMSSLGLPQLERPSSIACTWSLASFSLFLYFRFWIPW